MIGLHESIKYGYGKESFERLDEEYQQGLMREFCEIRESYGMRQEERVWEHPCGYSQDKFLTDRLNCMVIYLFEYTGVQTWC